MLQQSVTNSLIQSIHQANALEQGTLVFLRVKKKGAVRGGLTYNNDTVDVLMWTGFDYRELGRRSLSKYNAMLKDHLLSKVQKEASTVLGESVELDDVCVAVQELGSSLQVFGSDATSQFEGEVDSNWRPFEIDSRRVKNAKVYVGPPRKGMVSGQVYLQGMKIGDRVVEPAVNGDLPSMRGRTKTKVKDMVRSWLPLGHYCQYTLDDTNASSLRFGREAAQAAKEAGIIVDPAKIESLFA